jgi:ribosomal protein L11 methyltransferase
MQWNEITVDLPFSLLESTYSFLWPYINGISAEKKGEDFLLRSYVFSSSPENLIKRLNKFLHIRQKSYQTKCLPPCIHQVNVPPSDSFIIVPSPTSCIPPFGIPLHIQRGRAFGIGSHPCTIYCLEALKSILHHEPDGYRKVLDAGTGTGILAIAAAKLGITDITGVEISFESLQEAQENINLNGKSHAVRLVHSSVTDITDLFPLVIANLYGPLLVTIAPSLAELLAVKGLLILGGMAVPHDDIVISTFSGYGLKVRMRYRDEEWSAAVLQKG